MLQQHVKICQNQEKEMQQDLMVRSDGVPAVDNEPWMKCLIR